MLTRTLPRLKPLLALAISAICLWALWHQVAGVSWSELIAAFQQIAVWQWAVALAATGGSFWAIGHYDVVWHRHMGTGIAGKEAHRTGVATVAITQTVGLGTVTGTFLRWHLLRDMPLKTSAALTIAVSLSFFACWAVLAVLSAGWVGLTPVAATVTALGGLGALATFAMRFEPVRAHVHLVPSLMVWSTLDLVFAALALWILLPPIEGVGFGILLAAFTLALGAGLISNAPGGLGAFDLALIALVPAVPNATVLATILAFRLVYYVVPALAGAAVLLASHLRGPTTPSQVSHAPISDLCHQGAVLTQTTAGPQVVRRHLLGSVVLEPQAWDFESACQAFGFQSLYKCTAEVAAHARRHGWTVRRIATDAIISPKLWTTTGPARSQLRRKLRQADKAGITIVRAGRATPDPAMAVIAAEWQATHGGELGYAMGRYDPAYVAHQSTYLIYQDQTLCGFITVQTRATAWAIDLIRHRATIPHGAMHAAVTRIISDAATADVMTLSLGAVPDGPDDHLLQRGIMAKKAGLRQFKAAFGPLWAPRYHAAPTQAQWALSLALATWHIQRPAARLLERLGHTLTNLIKMERIIHLIHNKESDITPLNEITSGAPADDQPTFETARRA